MKKIISIIAIFSLLGCAATKDRKALGRVLTSQELTNQVGKVWLASHPCVTVAPIVTEGKTVTVIDSTYSKDEIDKLNSIIDSLWLNTPDNPINVDSLRKELLKACKPTKTIITRVDTLREPDLQLLNISNQEKAALQGELNATQKQASELQKSSTKKTWWIVGISIAAILIIAGLTYLLFKK